MDVNPRNEDVTEVDILFVCTGNICRSPLAEGVLKRMLAQAGLADRVRVDSAGTTGYHAGEAPHPGVAALAREHGVELDGKRARQVSPEDAEAFDLLIGMTRSHRDALAGAGDKVRLLADFADFGDPDVHDPYYSGDFEKTYRQVEAGCRGLLEHLKRALA